MSTTSDLSTQLDRLAAFEAGPFPVVSLYLNLQPDQHGRDNFLPFLRKELSERLRTYPARGPEHESLEQDVEKIRQYVEGMDSSINGLAVFACSGADLFEAIPLAAPIHEHRLHVSDLPHLYPLARLMDEYPRYAVLVADTHAARILVFAANSLQRSEEIEGTKTRRHKMGGWSQARYQRHMENYHLQHAKEIADALARIVREESIDSVVISGEEVILPLLREQFAKEVTDRLVDIGKLDIHALEREILETTLAALRQKHDETDRAKVDALIGAYRANGLGVVGAAETRKALDLGQVDELIITSTPETIDASERADDDVTSDGTVAERVADELVAKARQTAATIYFVQDPARLEAIGGVGALLRFKR